MFRDDMRSRPLAFAWRYIALVLATVSMSDKRLTTNHSIADRRLCGIDSHSTRQSQFPYTTLHICDIHITAAIASLVKLCHSPQHEHSCRRTRSTGQIEIKCVAKEQLLVDLCYACQYIFHVETTMHRHSADSCCFFWNSSAILPSSSRTAEPQLTSIPKPTFSVHELTLTARRHLFSSSVTSSGQKSSPGGGFCCRRRASASLGRARARSNLASSELLEVSS